jgi:alkylated DNA repair protein (DNA oxidative demethylase)
MGLKERPAGAGRCGVVEVNGVEVFPGRLGPEEQAALVEDLRAVVARAPMFAPVTRFGKRMSVSMTSAGKYGWYSDARGYRYEPRHPSGAPWPPIPARLLALWHEVTGLERQPDSCLINHYREGARMGLHQDRDEADFRWPVLSVSLGDDALFRVGTTTRGGPTRSVWLRSGDVAVLGGPARLAYHGIDRIRFGSSRLLPFGGRLNVTLRVVG